MAMPSHLNPCCCVWKRRAHKELVDGLQACPQLMHSSAGVRCLVTAGVWEVGGLPASGRPLQWQTTHTLTGSQEWRTPSQGS